MQVGMFRSSVTQAAYRPENKSARRVALVVSAIALAVLAGCASRQTQAPVTDLSGGEGTSSSVPATGSYVVKPGDTLYKIAQAHNMEVGALVRLNNITDPSQLRVGQSLRMSGTAAPAKTPGAAAPVAPVPVTEPTAEPSTAARASDANIISWGWPASGKIIQSFNSNTKGIDIAGAAGDPVVAAASGKVMYAGNGVRGLGNLILLGHDSGFITAYAHNQKLLVKTGQSVQKGAKIAAIGQTDTTSPRLHFEIRRSGTPVNPMSYLPSR